jgi:hypothetical protein
VVTDADGVEGAASEVTSITLNEGESAVCTIENDDDAPELTLVKEVTNDDGGDNDADEWTLTASGTSGGFTGAGTCDDVECDSATNGPNEVDANVTYGPSRAW